jgi:hypothetical protein
MIGDMTNSDEFMARLDQDLRDLATSETRLAAEEESIRARRNELRVRIADLTRLRDVYREYMGMQPVSQSDRGLFDTTEMPRTGTIADMAYVALKQHGGPMRVKDVQAELTRVGKLRGAQGDYGTLFGSLARDPRFKKAGRGLFRIADSTNGTEQPAEQSPVAAQE